SFCSFFFFSSRRRHTRSYGDWSSDVCSSDLNPLPAFVNRFGAAGVVLAADLGRGGAGRAGGTASALRHEPRGEHQRRSAGRNHQIGRASCRERGEVSVGGVVRVEEEEGGEGE